ncbi:MAG: hypothetical protein NDI69_11005 [Bacteriovoracaceae bacterium]|nr:hypothetical protein [Bacteriovoracaceae bacterium]
MIKSLILFPFLISSALSATIIPFERDVPRVERFDYITANNRESKHYLSHFGSYADELYYRGFGIHNVGPNDIVPTTPEWIDYPSREFFFNTNDHARRDTFIWITDSIGSNSVSDYAETILFFLPRQNQMHVEEHDESLAVTLTTGEEVSFFKKYKTLDGGVLKEEPVDLNPIRSERKHAQLAYSGKGIILRSDAWGADPRLAKTVQVLKAGLPACNISGPTFWTQEGFPKFKFVRDEDAYAVIMEKCGQEYLPEM